MTSGVGLPVPGGPTPWPKAGIEGITAGTPHEPIVRAKSFDDYPGCVARATRLRNAKSPRKFLRPIGSAVAATP